MKGVVAGRCSICKDRGFIEKFELLPTDPNIRPEEGKTTLSVQKVIEYCSCYAGNRKLELDLKELE